MQRSQECKTEVVTKSCGFRMERKWLRCFLYLNYQKGMWALPMVGATTEEKADYCNRRMLTAKQTVNPADNR
jgi:hypothetical protein